MLVVLGTAVPAHAADALAIDSTTPGLDHGGVTFTGTVSCTGGGALDSPGTRLTTALADVNGNVIPTFGLLANQDAATNGFMLPIPCDGSPQHWMIGLDGFEAILNLGGFNSGNSIQVTVTLTSLLPAHVSGR